jgi:hypothetical protein
MSIDPTRGCRLPGCGGPAQGVCINNLPFDECPDVVPIEDVDGQVEERTTPDIVVTGRTGPMSLAEADAFLRANGGMLLALVAPPGTGKTTLCATIYELALRERLKSLGFAGSETITAFEERCFLSRLSSPYEKPETPRTPGSSPVAFLHIALALEGGQRLELLLTDRSGEHFDDALNQPERFGEFPEFGRADAVLLLVDADRLDRAHHAEVNQIRKLVIGLGQAGRLENRRLVLVMTKIDKIPAERWLVVQERIEKIHKDSARRVPSAEISIHYTTCRTRPGSAEIGEGISELILATIPAPESKTFSTTLWNPGTGGTALDRLNFTVENA